MALEDFAKCEENEEKVLEREKFNTRLCDQHNSILTLLLLRREKLYQKTSNGDDDIYERRLLEFSDEHIRRIFPFLNYEESFNCNNGCRCVVRKEIWQNNIEDDLERPHYGQCSTSCRALDLVMANSTCRTNVYEGRGTYCRNHLNLKTLHARSYHFYSSDPIEIKTFGIQINKKSYRASVFSAHVMWNFSYAYNTCKFSS